MDGSKAIAKLNARKVASARPGKHGDGSGLWLHVRENGLRTWVFRFMRNGRAREMGLGPVQDVSLADARTLAQEARKLLRDGLDPIDERLKARTEAQGAKTFRECCLAYITAHKPSWRNKKHAAQWEATLATYAFPVIGNLPAGAVDTARVMRILEPIWTTKPETASRLRGRIERILDWATVRGYRTGDNPARWRGHLSALLPAKSKVRTVKHHKALPYTDIPAFMADLRQRKGIAAQALQFAILTSARSGEVREMTWDEISGECWTVPAERMKAGKEHRVPLGAPTLTILEAMKAHSESGYVFPGAKPKRPMSDMTLTAVLKRMGQDVTAHGFRSTFRDWVSEQTAYPGEVAESALAHTQKDKVEAAYRRGDLFEKRRRLMSAWADYCEQSPAKGDVLPLPIKGGMRHD